MAMLPRLILLPLLLILRISWSDAGKLALHKSHSKKKKTQKKHIFLPFT